MSIDKTMINCSAGAHARYSSNCHVVVVVKAHCSVPLSLRPYTEQGPYSSLNCVCVCLFCVHILMLWWCAFRSEMHTHTHTRSHQLCVCICVRRTSFSSGNTKKKKKLKKRTAQCNTAIIIIKPFKKLYFVVGALL